MERSYGVLKRRFPILHFGMQVRNLPAAQKLICVCAILHNMCIDHGDINVDDFEEIQEPVEESNELLIEAGTTSGLSLTNVRSEIVQIFQIRLFRNNHQLFAKSNILLLCLFVYSYC